MKEHGDRPVRSIAKSISWRIIATLTTMALVFFFTRKFVLALELGFLEVVLKVLFFYSHERFWNKIEWGKLNEREKPAGNTEIRND